MSEQSDELEELRRRHGFTTKPHKPYARRPECQVMRPDGRKCRLHIGHDGAHVTTSKLIGRETWESYDAD